MYVSLSMCVVYLSIYVCLSMPVCFCVHGICVGVCDGVSECLSVNECFSVQFYAIHLIILLVTLHTFYLTH